MPFVGTNALTELWAKVKTRLDGKLGAKNANGYTGMTKPDGTDADYIRTTNSGIIPYASSANGSSYLGTSGWPFRSVSAREFRTGNDVLINETGVKESWLSWGGKNWNGSMSPVGVAMSTEHNPNRLAFINGDALTFEYSSDGGTSWTNYNYSAGVKSQVCTLSYSVPIGRPDGTTEYQIEQSKTRITLAAQSYVYTNPRKMLIRMSSSATCSMLVEYKTGQENAAWQTFGTYSVSGWSGWNDIPLILGTLGGGSTQYSNNWFLRLTFHPINKNASYPKQCDLLSIRIYGDNDWNTASSVNKKGPISGTGHLYSYDMNASATFPAQVTATQFNGPLSGNATTATSVGTEAGVNTSINRLSTGSSNPTDNDYYIAQYAGGGTTTTTYHRRPHSALWNYINGKISSVLGLTATNYNGKAATAGTADAATKAGVEDSFNTSTTIGAATDWNTITDAGWYAVASSSAWVTDKHAPVGAYTYGMLSVSKKGKTGNIVVQTYNAHNNGKVYSRNKYNASDWTSWIELSANTWRGIQDNLTSDSATDSLSAKQGKALKTAVDAKYTKPSTGIPKTDLASAVQTSLGKADTALQEHQSLAAYATKTYASDIFQPKGSYATTTQLDSLKNNVVVFDTEYTFANDTYTFTPKVWKNGEDITSTVAAAKFTWKMNDSSGLAVKTASGVKTFTVAKDEIHYVGSVVCECDL